MWSVCFHRVCHSCIWTNWNATQPKQFYSFFSSCPSFFLLQFIPSILIVFYIAYCTGNESITLVQMESSALLTTNCNQVIIFQLERYNTLKRIQLTQYVSGCCKEINLKHLELAKHISPTLPQLIVGKGGWKPTVSSLAFTNLIGPSLNRVYNDYEASSVIEIIK